MTRPNGKLNPRLLFVQSLTLGRIPLILLFVLIHLFFSMKGHRFLFSMALGLLIVAALSDAFDGYFARRWGLVTRLGAYADPLTDKIFYLAALPTLVCLAALQHQVFHSRLLLALTVAFLLRDQWVSFLRSIGALNGVDARANWSGKARTVIAFPAVCCIYYYLEGNGAWLLQLPLWFMYVIEILCLVINLISIWVYTAYYWPSLRKEISTDPHS